jgi:uridine phosphorylase
MSGTISLDKSQKTLGQPQYHIHVRPGEVGKYVLLPGDPDRVLRIAQHLENAREIAFHREHRTWTGTYKGITVSATSTGMGCPSAAIATEELANVGATHFIRVGSTGALQKGMSIGDIVVSTGAMRLDGTTRMYAHEGYPSLPDYFLTKALFEAAVEKQKQRDYRVFMGVNASSDAFYAETSALYRAGTGLEMTTEELQQVGERVSNLKKAYNVREGWKPQDDWLPDRLFDEPLPTGVAKGTVLTREELREMIQGYYEARGWTPDGQIPASKLAQLGLGDLAAGDEKGATDAATADTV